MTSDFGFQLRVDDTRYRTGPQARIVLQARNRQLVAAARPAATNDPGSFHAAIHRVKPSRHRSRSESVLWATRPFDATPLGFSATAMKPGFSNSRRRAKGRSFLAWRVYLVRWFTALSACRMRMPWAFEAGNRGVLVGDVSWVGSSVVRKNISAANPVMLRRSFLSQRHHRVHPRRAAGGQPAGEERHRGEQDDHGGEGQRVE